MAFTPVRVVCQNTLVTGLGQSTILQNIVHAGDMNAMLEQRTKLLAMLAKSQSDTIESFNKMATTILRAGDIRDIIEEAYPTPDKPGRVAFYEELQKDESDPLLSELYGELTSAQERWQHAVMRATELRTQALELAIKISDEHPNIAMTAWCGYNAVVENEDYRDGAQSLFASALWGPRARAKIRAYQSAVARI
jgi:hypothetical protein